MSADRLVLISQITHRNSEIGTISRVPSTAAVDLTCCDLSSWSGHSVSEPSGECFLELPIAISEARM